jgi:hypothetical protein
MRICWLSLFVAFLASANNQASAQDARITSAEMTWFGIYTVANPSETKAAEGPRVKDSGIIPPTTNSEQVVLRRGVRFGFGYVLAGVPANGRVNVNSIFKYPAPGVPDRVRLTRVLQRFAFDDCEIGAKYCLVGFVVDDPKDLPIGVWTFELYDEKRLLAEKSFTVSLP